MRVIMTCASTAGHINPAIGVANIIKKNFPGSEILFIGTKTGMELELVKNAGYEIKSIETGKLIRSITLKNIKGISNAFKGIGDAMKIMKEFKPDLVIGTGGYICVSVMRAARLLKIRYILHESNAFPGLAVKILAREACRVLLGFEEASGRLRVKKNVVVTGNITKITKEEFEALDKEKCKDELGLKNIKSKIVLVTFGSQGAKYLNEYIVNLAKKQDKDFFFILITGKNNYDEVMKKIKDAEKEENIDLSKYIKVEKFVYDMGKMYKVSDICITRSGAMTINELQMVKRPAILIPLPTAAENHQYYNAKVLENVHAASILEQKNLSLEVLYNKLVELKDSNVYNACCEAFNRLPVNNAEEKILKVLREINEAYLK
ncbi:MAG: undecaprenyldiphospho-muramoylpentapeptide beta-N-acetylglucosaminyltransferase [Clostridia bacterium]|nr:undecaprenyldiphospho-muramoylpentapeptide beta-N-acetylglucosaminyltransferase [Clostridia bacterium]